LLYALNLLPLNEEFLNELLHDGLSFRLKECLEGGVS
jgi:hypothetical protein